MVFHHCIFSDNRTYKKLIEHYNTETSSYQVKHTEDEKGKNVVTVLVGMITKPK